jgi:hypothetical protein
MSHNSVEGESINQMAPVYRSNFQFTRRAYREKGLRFLSSLPKSLESLALDQSYINLSSLELQEIFTSGNSYICQTPQQIEFLIQKIFIYKSTTILLPIFIKVKPPITMC